MEWAAINVRSMTISIGFKTGLLNMLESQSTQQINIRAWGRFCHLKKLNLIDLFGCPSIESALERIITSKIEGTALITISINTNTLKSTQDKPIQQTQIR
jgi:hypothetical protein